MKLNTLFSTTIMVASMLAATSCGSSNNNAEQPPLPVATAVCEGVTTLEIDSATTLITLRDNAEPSTQPNRLFYGKDNKDSAKVEQLSPSGSVPSSIHAFLVKKDNKLALFDTGNGIDKGGKLLSRLDSAGYGPENIDYIILTHMHGDHIGGLLSGDSVVYARAEVFVPQVECQYWLSQSNGNGQLAARVVDAYGSRLHQFSFTDTTALPLGIRAMAAIGHTPGHSVYSVSGNRLLITGDLIHGYDLQCQDMNISPSYDINPEQAAHARKFFYSLAARKHSIIAGMHLPGNGVLIEVEPVQEMETQTE